MGRLCVAPIFYKANPFSICGGSICKQKGMNKDVMGGVFAVEGKPFRIMADGIDTLFKR